MMMPEWPVGDVSCWEVMELLTMNPTPERRLSVGGFQEQKRVIPVPSS